MINFNNIKSDIKKTSLPETWYSIVCNNTKLKSTAKGGQMIVAELDITSPANFIKRKVWNNFNLGESSLWVLKKFLNVSKCSIIEQGDVSEQTIADVMVGLTCDVYLIPDVTNNGTPTNRIKNYAELGTGIALNTNVIPSVPSSNNDETDNTMFS